jgi:hypothetical protein
MKRFFLLALVTPVLLTSCMTRQVLAKAQGKPICVTSDEELAPDPMPAYYAMLPISVPVDLVFLPFGLFREMELKKEREKCN